MKQMNPVSLLTFFLSIWFIVCLAPVGSTSISQNELEEPIGSYIVTFREGILASAIQKHHLWLNDVIFLDKLGGSELNKQTVLSNKVSGQAHLKSTYNIAGQYVGYSARLPSAAVVEQVRAHPDVSFTELATLFMSH
jgi:hypothetical protein